MSCSSPCTTDELISWATARCLAAGVRSRVRLVDEDDVLDEDLAERLAGDQSVTVRERLARSKQVSPALRARLCEDHHPTVAGAAREASRVLAGPVAPCGERGGRSLWRAADVAAAAENASELRRIAQGRDLSSATVQALLGVGRDDPELLYHLAGQPFLDAGLIADLAAALRAHPGAQAAWAPLAEHPNTPAEVLHEIVVTPRCSSVLLPARAAALAAAHPSASSATIDAFLDRLPAEHWTVLARAPRLEAGQVARLVAHAQGPSVAHPWALRVQLARQEGARREDLLMIGALAAGALVSGRSCSAKAAKIVPALYRNPSTPPGAFGPLPWRCLSERHRAMALSRLLTSGAGVEIAAGLWEELDGTCAEVAERAADALGSGAAA